MARADEACSDSESARKVQSRCGFHLHGGSETEGGVQERDVIVDGLGHATYCTLVTNSRHFVKRLGSAFVRAITTKNEVPRCKQGAAPVQMATLSYSLRRLRISVVLVKVPGRPCCTPCGSIFPSDKQPFGTASLVQVP